MVNPLFYIFGLFIALLYPLGIEPLTFVSQRIILLPAPVASVILLTLLYGLITVFVLQWAVSRDAIHASLYDSRRRLSRVRLWLRLLIPVFYGVEIFIFHVPSYLQETAVRDWPGFALQLLSYLPFLALTSVHGLCVLRFEHKHRPDTPSFSGSLYFTLRGFAAFVLMPIMIILLLNHLLMDVEPVSDWVVVYPFIGWLTSIILVTLLILTAPLLLRLALGATPLPPGALRSRLEALCSRAAMPYSELLVWRTHGARVGNAFITGLTGSCRNIFFTDYLLQRLTPDEVEAVLSHEIGHAKGKHLLLTLMFSLSFILLVTLLFETVLITFQIHVLIALQFMLFVFLFWALLFGFMVRRFESQADFFGMRMCGDPEQFIAALERVADINVLPRDVPSHTHFSIGTRIQTLRQSLIDPFIPLRLDRRVAAIRRLLSIVLVLGGLACLWTIVAQIRTAPDRSSALREERRARELEKQQRWEEAEKLYSGLLDRGFENAELYLRIGDIQMKTNRPEKARSSFMHAQSGVRDPRQRIRIQERLRESDR